MKRMRIILEKFKKYKYLAIGLLILVYMSFFDVNSFQNHFKLNRIIRKLEKQKAFYQGEIEKDSIALSELTSDPSHIEKFAREKYLMKRDNEDVFIVVEGEND